MFFVFVMFPFLSVLFVCAVCSHRGQGSNALLPDLRQTTTVCAFLLPLALEHSGLLETSSCNKAELSDLKRALQIELVRIPKLKDAKLMTKKRFWEKCFSLRKRIGNLEAEIRNDIVRMDVLLTRGTQFITSELNAHKRCIVLRTVGLIWPEYLVQNHERIEQLTAGERMEVLKAYTLERMPQLAISDDWSETVDIDEHIAGYWKAYKRDPVSMIGAGTTAAALLQQLVNDDNSDDCVNCNQQTVLDPNSADFFAFQKDISEKCVQLQVKAMDVFATGSVQVPVDLLSKALSGAKHRVDCSVLSDALALWPPLNELLLQTLAQDLELWDSLNEKACVSEEVGVEEQLRAEPDADEFFTPDPFHISSKMFPEQFAAFQLKEHLLSAVTDEE